MKHKGRQDYTIWTVHGRVRLGRRRWHSARPGTLTPRDAWVDVAEASIRLGVRAMACRRNGDGKHFDQAADNLARTAPVHVRGATWRPLVQTQGQRVVGAQQSGPWAVDGSAADGPTQTGTTRIDCGSDGVLVPLVPATEKRTRRQHRKDQRRRRGRKAKPWSARQPGADPKYQECKILA